MRASISLFTFVLAAAASTLSAQSTAQRTWVVDQNAGAGVDFTDIPSAVQAASRNDTIIVRSGTYTPPKVSVGIKLIGRPGAQLQTSKAMLQVRDLPMGHTFLIAGFTTEASYATRLVFVNNRGKIIVEDIVTAAPPAGIERSPGATILDSDLVSFNHCELRGTPGILSTRSRVLISDCDVHGFSNWKGRIKGPALRAVDSRIDIAQPNFHGASDSIGPLASSAIVVAGGWLNIAGDNQAVIEGGSSTPGVLQYAIEADRCTVRFDTDIRLNPSTPQTRATAGTGLFIPDSMISVTATGKVSSGNELFAKVEGPAFAPAILLISLPEVPTATRFGTLWLSPQTSFVLNSDFLDSTGHWTASYTVPPKLAPGLSATLQAFVETSRGFRLSMPALIASH